MFSAFIDIFLLLVGFLFTFLIPGLYIIETFFTKLPKYIKLPSYLLLSVLTSTYMVYFVSLIIGFSRYSILVTFSFFIPWIILRYKKTIKTFINVLKTHRSAFIISLFVFVVYLVSLYPGIFTTSDGYIVMSSSNWLKYMNMIEDMFI